MRGAALVLGGWLVPGVAGAAEVDRFEPERELQLLGVQGIHIDTGWVPALSDIQASFVLMVDDNVLVEMPGEAVYDWETEQIHFVGDERAGVFDIDVGVVLEAKVRFDILGNIFESDVVGPYDLGVFESTEFTPYLLDEAAHVTKKTEPVEVFNYAIIDAVVASGNFFVDAAFDVDVALQCDSIDVSTPSGDATAVTMEAVPSPLLPPDDGSDLDATATLRCHTVADVTVLLYPGVEVVIGLQEFQLAPFELPVPVAQQQEDPFDFDPLALHFDAPEAPNGTGDGDGDSGSDSGNEGTSAGETGDSTSMPSEDGTGDDPGGDGESAPGCGCRSTNPRTFAWLAFVVLYPRRRSRTARASAGSKPQGPGLPG